MHGSYDLGRCYYQYNTHTVLHHSLTVAADVASSVHSIQLLCAFADAEQASKHAINQSIHPSIDQSINFQCAEKHQRCLYERAQVQYLLMRFAPVTRSSQPHHHMCPG